MTHEKTGHPAKSTPHDIIIIDTVHYASSRQTAAESAQGPRRHPTAPDLFPDTLPPRPLPIFPAGGSIRESALLALLAGPIRQSGFRPSWRLAAYVGFLRDDGWSIISRDVIEDGRTVAEYTLDLGDEPTRAAVAMYRRRQAGFISPELAGWLLVLGVVAVMMLTGGGNDRTKSHPSGIPRICRCNDEPD